MDTPRVADEPEKVAALLERWTNRGLITPGQARRIAAAEHVRLPVKAADEKRKKVRQPGRGEAPGGRTSLVTEALGYVGGVLVAVAAVLITVEYWSDVPVGIRIGVIAVVALLLLAAGVRAAERLGDAGIRLRGVLWLLSVGAVAGFFALVAVDVMGWSDGENVAVMAAGGAALYAAALWQRHPGVLQHAALLLALVGTASAGAAHLGGDTAPGLAAWGLGLAWIVLGWGGLLPPRDAAYLLGSIVVVFGALTTMAEGWGHILAVVTAAALVSAGVLIGQLAMLAVGAVATLVILPSTMAYYFSGALAAPIGLLLAGTVLLVIALRTVRVGRDRWRPAPSFSTGDPRTALIAAGVVVSVVTTAVVTIGLA